MSFLSCIYTFVACVAVISRTGAFRRNHGCTQWIFRVTQNPKSRTLRWLFDPLEDLTCDTDFRFFCLDLSHVEANFGIECVIFGAEAQATLGYRADAAP